MPRDDRRNGYLGPKGMMQWINVSARECGFEMNSLGQVAMTKGGRMCRPTDVLSGHSSLQLCIRLCHHTGGMIAWVMYTNAEVWEDSTDMI